MLGATVETPVEIESDDEDAAAGEEGTFTLPLAPPFLNLTHSSPGVEDVPRRAPEKVMPICRPRDPFEIQAVLGRTVPRCFLRNRLLERLHRQPSCGQKRNWSRQPGYHR